MFSDVVPASFDWAEAEFDTHVKNGTVVKREMTLGKDGLIFRFIYFAFQVNTGALTDYTKSIQMFSQVFDKPQKMATFKLGD